MLLVKLLLLLDVIFLLLSQLLDVPLHLLQLKGCILLSQRQLITLLGLYLLELCEIIHQSVISLFIRLQVLLLSLGGPFFQLQLQSVLVHGISIEELLVACDTDVSATLLCWVIHGIRARLGQTIRAVHCPTELTTDLIINTQKAGGIRKA